jgi:hypothetical protein
MLRGLERAWNNPRQSIRIRFCGPPAAPARGKNPSV